MASRPGAPGEFRAAAAAAHSAFPHAQPFDEGEDAPSAAGPYAMRAERREGMDDFLHRLPPNPLAEVLAQFLASLFELGSNIRDNLFSKSPVIILSGGAALAANHFATQHYPSLAGSSDQSFEGSVNVAKFVSVALLLEAALAPLFQIVFVRCLVPGTKGKIHANTIHYLNPLALTLIFAYKTGLNVKSLYGTLYTAGIFVLIKVLGMGYDRALKAYDKATRSSESSMFG